MVMNGDQAVQMELKCHFELEKDFKEKFVHAWKRDISESFHNIKT